MTSPINPTFSRPIQPPENPILKSAQKTENSLGDYINNLGDISEIKNHMKSFADRTVFLYQLAKENAAVKGSTPLEIQLTKTGDNLITILKANLVDPKATSANSILSACEQYLKDSSSSALPFLVNCYTQFPAAWNHLKEELTFIKKALSTKIRSF